MSRLRDIGLISLITRLDTQIDFALCPPQKCRVYTVLNDRHTVAKGIKMILSIVFSLCLPHAHALHRMSRLREEFSDKKNKTFIVKPDASCRGKGIFLTRSFDSIRRITENMVAQRYMHKVRVDG